MKPNQTHIDEIKADFENMKSKEDLLRLLNKAKPLVYGDKAVPVELKQLTWHANPKLGGKRYIEFKIKKKSGAERSIHAPVRGLKSLQKTLSFVLQCVYEPHRAAMGFVRDRSVVTNAKWHVGSRYVYNIDLKDFFPSVDQTRVWKCLQMRPFNLNKAISPVEPSHMGWEEFEKERVIPDEFNTPRKSLIVANNSGTKKEKIIRQGGRSLKEEDEQPHEALLRSASKMHSRLDIANIIASLCCTKAEVERKNTAGEWVKVIRRVLPQGAPTSPIMTNIVCQRLDYLLTGVANRLGLKYSRYADDITFSSMHNVYQPESEFIKELHRIIAEQGFRINESKTRLQKDGYRKEVTGLLVNEKANVQKRYVKQLRMWLYYWEKYGYKEASALFLKGYGADKGHLKQGHPEMSEVIAGKLNYLKMVKGGDNNLYLKLTQRFGILTINSPDDVKKDFLPSGSHYKEKKPHSSNANIRIEINPIDSVGREIILKEKIIINKGTVLPYEETFENKEKEFEEKEIDLSKHRPMDVNEFLSKFKNSDGLKYLTHDYDKPGTPFDYERILKTAKKEFDDFSEELTFPKPLFGRIKQFAFAGDPSENWWFNGKSYKLNWKSPELIQWIENNPGTHPIRNGVFERDLIDPFKKSIEIKAPELEKLVEDKLIKNLGSEYTLFDVNKVDLGKANFYTDVDALQRGLSFLIKAIKQRSKNSKKVRIKFSRKSDQEGRKKIIEIIHLGSKSSKPLDDEDFLGGDLLEAKNCFFGICDWSIISKSTEDSINKLNILFDIESDKKPKEKIDDSLIEGFTHTLTFYA